MKRIMSIDDNYRVVKGVEGERKVQEIIGAAIKPSGIDCKTYQNIILTNKNTIFGDHEYGMTTEIDHIVVTKNYIFVIETKNQEYSFETRISDKFWKLKNNESIMNPIYQNYVHKMLLCEKLNVERESIIQIVCLNNIPSGNIYNDKHYGINSHVFKIENNNTIEELAQMFLTTRNKESYDYEMVIDVLDRFSYKSKSLRDLHIKNVKEANKILDAQKKQVRFDYTDAVYDDKGTLLKAKIIKTEKPFDGKRRKHLYRIALVNIITNKIVALLNEDNEIKILPNWGGPPKKKFNYQENIKILTLEERLGYEMNENFQMMLNSKIKVLQHETEEYRYKAEKLAKENEDLKEQIDSLKLEYRKLIIENSSYKPWHFNLYTKIR